MVDDLRLIRRELLAEFCRLPNDGDVMLWQRRLSSEIVETERQIRRNSKDAVELKNHRHLLHVIGDSLVYALLPTHTIRTLSENRTRPASLIGQGADFDFVLDTAQRFQRKGYVPIVCDLTTLMSVGDIVVRRGDDIVIVECKNSNTPKQLQILGRLARQRERGALAETYLRESRIAKPEGITKVATPTVLPSPDWDTVDQLLTDLDNSANGISAANLGPNDKLLAISADLQDFTLLERYMSDSSSCALPTSAFYGTLIDHPDYIALPPSSYPVSASRRSNLLERDIILCRLADMAALNSEFNHNDDLVTLTTLQRNGCFSVEVQSDSVGGLSFTESLIDWCIWNPVSISAMRRYLCDYASLMVDRVRQGAEPESLLPLADGDNVLYGTIYKDTLAEGT